ncbi:hypothetical protein OTU49_004828 [Cherax quadricarinatus]|uniref:Uncharacterized protein n=1 Tax=Cherax quadricarinatus TaxID=27406 RepID=A0AAW0XD38_CHEQU
MNIPSCQDVNFSDQLETEINPAVTSSITLGSNPVSPASKLVNDKANNLQLSPLSTISERFQSPVGQSSARRTLFPASTCSSLEPPATLTFTRAAGLCNRLTPVSTASPTVHKPSSIITVQVKENGVTTLYTVPTSNTGSATAGDGSEESPFEGVSEATNVDKKKDKPKRHGSLALFCRKVTVVIMAAVHHRLLPVR